MVGVSSLLDIVKSGKDENLQDKNIVIEEGASITSNDDSDHSVRSPPRNHIAQRRLKARHIQLIGMGGSIGTILFVQIGTGLIKGGPGSLFLAFSLWCFPIIGLTSCTAEMVSMYPLHSPFVQLAGRVVDESLEITMGWLYFILESLLVPYEITAVTLIIHYWRDDFTPAVVIIPQVTIYMLINLLVPVSWFGEVEFWMALSKVLLIIGLIFFAFVTMVGGNPQHDAYGFRFWRDPGSFNEYIAEGVTGRFVGFASCLALASYTIVGPDYVSMTAGEAINPRRSLPSAFKGVLFRLTFFFALGSLAVGIVCPSNDPGLLKSYADGGTTNASSSPYVQGMIRMGIPVIPDIINVGIITSAFSAGNSYFYTSSRSLYGMAMDGKAPAIFKICTRNGVPIVAAGVSVGFAMLSFLQLSHSATVILDWIVAIGTVCMLMVYSGIAFTYIRFHKACVAQGVDRRSFPYRGWGQPYVAYFSFFCLFCMTFLAGFPVFLKGNWDAPTFITSYLMIPVGVGIFIFCKLWRKTKFLKPEEVDLTSGLKEVEEHEKMVVYKPPRNIFEKILRIVLGEA